MQTYWTFCVMYVSMANSAKIAGVGTIGVFGYQMRLTCAIRFRY